MVHVVSLVTLLLACCASLNANAACYLDTDAGPVCSVEKQSRIARLKESAEVQDSIVGCENVAKLVKLECNPSGTVNAIYYDTGKSFRAVMMVIAVEPSFPTSSTLTAGFKSYFTGAQPATPTTVPARPVTPPTPASNEPEQGSAILSPFSGFGIPAAPVRNPPAPVRPVNKPREK